MARLTIIRPSAATPAITCAEQPAGSASAGMPCLPPPTHRSAAHRAHSTLRCTPRPTTLLSRPAAAPAIAAASTCCWRCWQQLLALPLPAIAGPQPLPAIALPRPCCTGPAVTCHCQALLPAARPQWPPAIAESSCPAAAGPRRCTNTHAHACARPPIPAFDPAPGSLTTPACRSTGKVRRLEFSTSILEMMSFSAPCTAARSSRDSRLFCSHV